LGDRSASERSGTSQDALRVEAAGGFGGEVAWYCAIRIAVKALVLSDVIGAYGEFQPALPLLKAIAE